MSEPLIRDISDTARWVATYRARETERPDAAFRDPYARALAGVRGEQIAAAMPLSEKNSWAFVARTCLFDRFIRKETARGTDLIVSLAAGLDARPYRMDLPPTLKWVEVDLPEILDYKQQVLKDANPSCTLEHVRLDLANHDARRGLFSSLARRLGGGTRGLVLCEGLLIYLMPDEVGALARDLAGAPLFERWIVDIVSPGLLKMLDESMGALLRQSGAPLLFAPPEGSQFFTAYGWEPIEVRSILKAAGALGRLPPALRLISFLPESSGAQGSRPWAGVCLLSRADAQAIQSER